MEEEEEEKEEEAPSLFRKVIDGIYKQKIEKRNRNRIDRDADLTQSWQRGGGRAAVDGESRSNLADLRWSSDLSNRSLA